MHVVLIVILLWFSFLFSASAQGVGMLSGPGSLRTGTLNVLRHEEEQTQLRRRRLTTVTYQNYTWVSTVNDNCDNACATVSYICNDETLAQMQAVNTSDAMNALTEAIKGYSSFCDTDDPASSSTTGPYAPVSIFASAGITICLYATSDYPTTCDTATPSSYTRYCACVEPDPTASPTLAPTAAPTTAVPSAIPSTARPTCAPSTATPTQTPTTAAPTFTPVPTSTPSTLAPTATPTSGAASSSSSDSAFPVWAIVLIVIVVIVVPIIGIGLYRSGYLQTLNSGNNGAFSTGDNPASPSTPADATTLPTAGSKYKETQVVPLNTNSAEGES